MVPVHLVVLWLPLVVNGEFVFFKCVGGPHRCGYHACLTERSSLYVDYNLNDIHFPILLQKIVLRTLEIYLMHTTAQYLFFKNTDSLKPWIYSDSSPIRWTGVMMVKHCGPYSGTECVAAKVKLEEDLPLRHDISFRTNWWLDQLMKQSDLLLNETRLWDSPWICRAERRRRCLHVCDINYPPCSQALQSLSFLASGCTHSWELSHQLSRWQQSKVLFIF